MSNLKNWMIFSHVVHSSFFWFQPHQVNEVSL